jgi:hypothetical protein
MVTTRRLGEMMMILCAQKMGSRLTLIIPRILPNCGYAWTRKKWAREYQFWEVEDNKGYTSGVEEFGATSGSESASRYSRVRRRREVGYTVQLVARPTPNVIRLQDLHETGRYAQPLEIVEERTIT